TGPHNAEKTLLIPRLAAAAAARAGDRRTSLFGSAAGAFGAGFEPRYLDRFSFTFGGFFERDLQIVTQIRSALDRRTRPTASAENIAETEHIEDIFHVRKARIEPRRTARVAKSVISRALLRIGKHRVCFGAFLEFFLRLGISRILIRLILHGKFAVRRLYFAVACRSRNGQNLVIISFAHKLNQKCASPK